MKPLFQPQNVDSCVADAIINTFAEFVFMDAAYSENEILELAKPISSQILIHHPFCGEIELTAEEDLVAKMGENILMISPDDLTDAQKNDLLYELVNTLSGRILARLLPEDITFKLGLPETTESFMERDDQVSKSYYFQIDDQYKCKLTFLAEM